MRPEASTVAAALGEPSSPSTEKAALARGKEEPSSAYATSVSWSESPTASTALRGDMITARTLADAGALVQLPPSHAWPWGQSAGPRQPPGTQVPETQIRPAAHGAASVQAAVGWQC